jgi:hypothetical protein
VDLDRIAVDHGRPTYQVVRARGDREQQGGSQPTRKFDLFGFSNAFLAL